MPEIPNKFPNLSGLVDAKTEREIRLSFERVYNMLLILRENFKFLSEHQSSQLSSLQTKTDSLVNQLLSVPIIGVDNPVNPLVGVGSVTTFSVTDTNIFDVTNASTIPNLALKTQAKNKFLAGPTVGADAVPNFRLITAADISGLSLDATILDWLGQ